MTERKIMPEIGWFDPDRVHEYAPREAVNWTEEQWQEHDRKVAIENAKHEAAEQAQQAEHQYYTLINGGWPQRALNAARSADVSKAAIAKALSWKISDGNILVLSGPTGCGKTTAAARWALGMRHAVKFMRATTFAATSRYDQEFRNSITRARSMVIDDLGSEYADAKGNYLVDLDELVDSFYGTKRPLIVTTNSDSATFKSRYGSRIVDRIREAGVFFSISDDSMRRKP